MELVTFEIQGNHFAFRASAISQVLESLLVTPLPYAPPDVEGLVNVSGALLLKIDLALRLGMNTGAAKVDGNMVVVFTGYEKIALQVDRVHKKINLDEALLTIYAAEEHPKLVCGEFTLNERMVLLLDTNALNMRSMEPTGVPESGEGLIGFNLNDDSRVDTSKMPAMELVTITVEECGEAYALEMSHVQEIVEMGPITQLPGAAGEVEGLMQLRGQALLVVSLGALLHHTQRSQSRFVLVMNIQGIQLGLSVFSLYGIEHFAREAIQAVSQTQDAQLEGYLNGTALRAGRITGLLSMSGLFPPNTVAHYQCYLPRKSTSMHTEMHSTAKASRRLLSFRLGSERCALPLLLVDRVEAYSDSVNLPKGDQLLAGVIQIKGEIAPVVDLRKMLGMAALETTSYLIVRVDKEAWALIVDRIDRVIDLQESDITPVRNLQNDYLNEVGNFDGELISLITLKPLTLAAKHP